MLREGTDFLPSSFPTYTKEFSIEGAVVPGLLLCSKNKAKAQEQQCPLLKSLYCNGLMVKAAHIIEQKTLTAGQIV